MNIHGHKLRLVKIRKELKIGKRDLGDYRFNILNKRMIMHNNLILKLRKNKEVKVKIRRKKK